MDGGDRLAVREPHLVEAVRVAHGVRAASSVGQDSRVHSMGDDPFDDLDERDMTTGDLRWTGDADTVTRSRLSRQGDRKNRDDSYGKFHARNNRPAGGRSNQSGRRSQQRETTYPRLRACALSLQRGASDLRPE